LSLEYFRPSWGFIEQKKAPQCRALSQMLKNQAAFFFALDFFFLAAFLLAFGV
jgi:hypothetical protein